MYFHDHDGVCSGLPQAAMVVSFSRVDLVSACKDDIELNNTGFV